MLLILLLLLLLLLAQSKAEVQPCPAYFFTVTLPDYVNLGGSERTAVDYGNYFLRNETQLGTDFYLPSTLAHDIWERTPCAILIVIITDTNDIRMKRQRIFPWITSECARLGLT